MEPRVYRNFDVQVIKADDGYVTTISGPSGRRRHGKFAYPFKEYQLELYISKIMQGPQRVMRGVESGPSAASKELGARLFDSLFPTELRYELDVALDELVSSKDHGLRICLDLAGAPDLAELPWEYLFHPVKHTFLGLSPDTTIVRYVQAPEPIPPMRVEPPLRILAMVCSPNDQPELNIEEEQRRLERGLEQLRKARMVEIDWLPENSLSALNRTLARKEYHIFHFVGHGAFDERGRESGGVLFFEDEAQLSVPVTGETLGWALRRSVNLAVLNACESGLATVDNPSSGVASSLLQQGIPAVIAMQFKISDVAAVHFSHLFYAGIALGLPIDAAVTNARRDVMFSFIESAEWATPVLFMRSPNGELFDIQLDKLDHSDHDSVVEQVTITEDLTGRIKDNLDLESDKLKQLGELARRGVDVVGRRLPMSLPSSRSPEELYTDAVAAMDAERWDDAARLFKQINDRSPGYGNTTRLWMESEKQARLRNVYGDLIEAFVGKQWDKARRLCEQIRQEVPGYKDTEQLYADILAAMQPPRPPSTPKPTGLPRSRREASKPDVPPSRPEKAGKPPRLPGEGGRPKSSRPPSLPGS